MSALELSRPRAPYGLADDVALRVEPGQIVGLVGPNGAGKTTLLRCLAGELPATVTLGGQPLAEWTPRARARRVAVLVQEEPRPEGFTARAVVELGRLPHLTGWRGLGEADRVAVDAALRDTGVEHLAERRVETLSGGEYQRVRLARALAQAPDVLLLDEPEAHLDIGHRSRLMALLRRINRGRALTVIAALHALDVAAVYCDRLVLLHGGRLVAEGTPDAVLTAERLSVVYGAPIHVGRDADGAIRLGPRWMEETP